MKKVAVVISSRNMADTLGRAVEAAAGADELHIIDDASIDDTQAVLAQVPGKLYLWRWPKKSRCWVSALRVVYESIDADHIVWGGADDWLLPGLLPAVREYADAPVVFTDYDVVDQAGRRTWTISQDVQTPTALSPDEMRRRVQSDRNATETGIGSSVRRDVADWLWRNQFERMGRHCDSVGYTTAASLFGCVLLPIVGAAYTFTETSYGRPEQLSADDIVRAGQTCWQWMKAVGLDDDTAAAIARKRCEVKVQL